MEAQTEKGLEMAPRPTEDCLARMQTLEAFAEQLEKIGFNLSEGLAIGLEPAELVKKNLAEGKAAQTWALFIWRGKDTKARCDMKRGDLRFCRAVITQNLARGHYQLILEEEPGSSSSVVGHIIAETFNGIVVVRWNAGVDGEKFWELLPSSLSKGDLAGMEAEPIAIIFANHQRLGGASRIGAGMAVYEKKLAQMPTIKQDNPAWEGKIFTKESRPIGFKDYMSIFEFFKQTDDCRSGFALLKILMGRSVDELRKAMSLI